MSMRAQIDRFASARRDVRLVFAREVEARMATKGYLAGLLMAVAVIIGLGFSYSGGGGVSSYPVAACGAQAASFGPIPAGISVRSCSGTAAATAQVRSGQVDAAVTLTDGRVRVLDRSDTPAPARAAAEAMGAHWVLADILARHHISLAQVERAAAAAAPKAVTVTGNSPGSDGTGVRAELFAVSIGLVLAVGQIAVIAQGVAEEKSTRIVEVLMTTLTPLRLMAGKVAGIGTAAIVQVLAMASALAITEKLRQGNAAALPGPGELADTAAWFLLTFALFAFLAAAAGSLVSRSEDLQPVITPLVMAATAPLGVAVAAASNLTAPWITVFFYVPPFSGVLMPLAFSLHAVTIGQQLVAAGIMLLATAGCAWVGARIYRDSILKVGAASGWRQAVAAAWPRAGIRGQQARS